MRFKDIKVDMVARTKSPDLVLHCTERVTTRKANKRKNWPEGGFSKWLVVDSKDPDVQIGETTIMFNHAPLFGYDEQVWKNLRMKKPRKR